MRQLWDIGFDVLFSDEILRMIIEDDLLKKHCAQPILHVDCSQPSIFSYSRFSKDVNLGSVFPGPHPYPVRSPVFHLRYVISPIYPQKIKKIREIEGCEQSR